MEFTARVTAGIKKLLAGSLLVTVLFAFQPVPASRPRLARGNRIYYAKGYSDWRTAARKVVKEHRQRSTAKLIVVVECRMQKARTSKLEIPRADVDNLVKAPLDVINGACWEDDNQIVGLWVTKEFAADPESVGTTVTIYEV
jgi:Holliday junction resolvase RusA-like endonuclease